MRAFVLAIFVFWAGTSFALIPKQPFQRLWKQYRVNSCKVSSTNPRFNFCGDGHTLVDIGGGEPGGPSDIVSVVLIDPNQGFDPSPNNPANQSVILSTKHGKWTQTFLAETLTEIYQHANGAKVVSSLEARLETNGTITMTYSSTYFDPAGKVTEDTLASVNFDR